ncbi:hypothetical protein, partial [Ruminococcus flavefaciens]|uniref:hypothetical protein n=1 Tax=Ruminococcus flavefaciens TaxID=1265 RepID=UPI000565243A
AGLAIASFVISLVNMILCCTLLSIVTVPLCLIFSIASLVKKRKGTAFAIIGIIISLLSGLAFAYYGFFIYKIMPDVMYFAEHQEQIIEDYDRDGTIPERYEKYRDPKFNKYWKQYNCDSFDEFFEKEFINKYRTKPRSDNAYTSTHGSGHTNDLSLGFRPALII